MISLRGQGSEGRCNSTWLQGALCPSEPSLNCCVHSHDSSFLQDTALNSLAPGLLTGSFPDVLITARKFKVPLRTLRTFSDVAPGSFGVLRFNTF